LLPKPQNPKKIRSNYDLIKFREILLKRGKTVHNFLK